MSYVRAIQYLLKDEEVKGREWFGLDLQRSGVAEGKQVSCTYLSTFGCCLIRRLSCGSQRSLMVFHDVLQN